MTDPGPRHATAPGTEEAEDADAVVVGGGAAGLTAAFELTRLGRQPVVLEASGELGGCVRAQRVGGLLLDAGAESFATARPAVPELIADLGMADRIATPNPAGAWVFFAGRAAPLPAGGLLGIPPRPLAADVRRVVGLSGSLRGMADRILPRSACLGGSLGTAVRARLGGRIRDRLVAPVAGGVYSAPPEEIELDARWRAAIAAAGSLSAAAAQLRAASGPAGSAVAGLDGGMHTLVAALADRIGRAGGVIDTGAPVVGLTRRPPDGWLLSIGGDRPRTLRTGTVIVAVDGTCLNRLLGPLLDGLPDGRAAMDRLPGGRPLGHARWPDQQATAVVVVTLLVDSSELDENPRGTGVLVAPGGGVQAKALTHATAKWAYLARAAGPGRHVLRLSYGRADRQPPPPDVALGAALTDAGTLLGVTLRPGQVRAEAARQWQMTPPARPGWREEIAGLVHHLQRYPALGVTGAAIAGTGLSAVVSHARDTARAVCGTSPGPAVCGTSPGSGG